MDGAKAVTETMDHLRMCGRQACWQGRSLSERLGGPASNDNPGGSRNRAW